MGITRIDFTVAGDIIVVNKLDELPDRPVVVEQRQHPKENLDTMLKWCEDNGFAVRRFLPLGARAWRGNVRPIRTSAQIRRRRDELMRYPVDGLNVVALDLAYDC